MNISKAGGFCITYTEQHSYFISSDLQAEWISTVWSEVSELETLPPFSLSAERTSAEVQSNGTGVEDRQAYREGSCRSPTAQQGQPISFVLIPENLPWEDPTGQHDKHQPFEACFSPPTSLSTIPWKDFHFRDDATRIPATSSHGLVGLNKGQRKRGWIFLLKKPHWPISPVAKVIIRNVFRVLELSKKITKLFWNFFQCSTSNKILLTHWWALTYYYLNRFQNNGCVL